ncbi:hypothetical protein FRAHR75_80029 [Frankia sp. Hr75.2]|nr:hypothetical protein FRAHR75_80029 [Frankia sp. Hr75.2]SQD99098.1 hypothetical protein FMEAI12_5110015 [Parafrankia sp. Ea1.12]
MFGQWRMGSWPLAKIRICRWYDLSSPPRRTAAESVCGSVRNGCTSGCVSHVAMWGAATPLRRGTPVPMRTPTSTPSSARTNRARTGAGATSTRPTSSGHGCLVGPHLRRARSLEEERAHRPAGGLAADRMALVAVRPQRRDERDQGNGDADLKNVPNPVDARRVTHADCAGDHVSDQGADYTDDHGEPDWDILPPAHDKSCEKTDDETCQHYPNNLKHDGRPPWVG